MRERKTGELTFLAFQALRDSFHAAKVDPVMPRKDRIDPRVVELANNPHKVSTSLSLQCRVLQRSHAERKHISVRCWTVEDPYTPEHDAAKASGGVTTREVSRFLLNIFKDCLSSVSCPSEKDLSQSHRSTLRS